MSSDALCGPLVEMQAERGDTALRFIAEQKFDSGTQHLLIQPQSYTAVDLSGATFSLTPYSKMEGLFYMPKAANNPLFDSFFRGAENMSAHCHCLDLSSDHRQGLRRLIAQISTD